MPDRHANGYFTHLPWTAAMALPEMRPGQNAEGQKAAGQIAAQWLESEAIEAARRRLAELPDTRARNADEREREDISGLSVEQILLRGWMRAQLATE
jgi:hypothetical protein